MDAVPKRVDLLKVLFNLTVIQGKMMITIFIVKSWCYVLAASVYTKTVRINEPCEPNDTSWYPINGSPLEFYYCNIRTRFEK